MTQKEAVFQAVSSVLSNYGISVSSTAPTSLNRSMRSEVNTILVNQLQNGTIAVSSDSSINVNDNAKVRAYVSGLVSNWLRKDTRLNGGVSNKTSKKSSKPLNDPQLKALKTLLKVETDTLKRREITSHIANREAELSSATT